MSVLNVVKVCVYAHMIRWVTCRQKARACSVELCGLHMFEVTVKLCSVQERDSFDCPAVVVKCRHAFGVLFPLRASLRKELGEQLLSTGLVGAAMGVFEEEELWDSLIICYRLLQKLPQAQELVHARLQVSQLLLDCSSDYP